MTEEIVLSDAQVTCLQTLQANGKVDAKTVDKRSVKALEKKGLAKISETKKGEFVALTAKGKKAAVASVDAPAA
jgi:predicted transcriptional regulator